MNSISSSDLLMATATFRGRTIANISSRGFATIADVVRAVRAAAGSVVGVIELTLRNASKGWRERRTVFITPPPAGIQLSFDL